jgi:hypothetical protein
MEVSGKIHATVTLSQAHLASCWTVTGIRSQRVNLSRPYSLWLRLSEAVPPFPRYTSWSEQIQQQLTPTSLLVLRYWETAVMLAVQGCGQASRTHNCNKMTIGLWKPEALKSDSSLTFRVQLLVEYCYGMRRPVKQKTVQTAWYTW